MGSTRVQDASLLAADRRTVKCVVWDLDETLWRGTLLEDECVSLAAGVAEVIRGLDARGILVSIASRNHYGSASAKLEEFGLREYFLVPQINWNAKSASIRTIAASLNLGLDALAFVDDQEFELDEVGSSLPEVLCINASEIDSLLDRPELTPPFVTEDASRRRALYVADEERSRAEQEFIGPKEEFLAGLRMRFEVFNAQEADLQRAEELTLRTNQLNTTGYTYSYEELDRFRLSDEHKLLLARLDDRYGPYGTIGLALVEMCQQVWTLKLVLMSCRVMSRGVGMIMINHIRNLAEEAGARLLAEFRSNDRNRMMYVTYKFSGFTERDRRDGVILLEADLSTIPPFPPYVDVVTDAAS